jgi:hypothetical protein
VTLKYLAAEFAVFIIFYHFLSILAFFVARIANEENGKDEVL